MSAEAMAQAWAAPYTGSTKLVMLAVAEVVNDAHDNEFWMKLSNLADKAKCERKTCTRALARLVGDGWLEVTESGGGYGKSTVYRWLGPPRADRLSGQNVPVDSGDTGTSRPPTGTSATATPIAENKEPKGHAVAQSEDPVFDRFWQAYPRRLDKARARKAWQRAVRRADAVRIIAGAERYAAERKGQDAQFTKHPTTWLNADAWENEPEAPAAPPPPGARLTGMDAVKAYAEQNDLFDDDGNPK